MSGIHEWLTIVGIGSLAVMSPGPNFVITLRNSLSHRQAGIYTALGLAIADLVHITYCLLGIGVLIAQSILLFTLLKWMGAAYLIYIGLKSLKSRAYVADSQLTSGIPLHPGGAFRIGFLTCLLNPKVTLFFLALFTQIIQPQTPVALQVLYGLTVTALELGWFMFVAVSISHTAIRGRLEFILHWSERLMGGLLIGLGVRLAIAPGQD